MIIIFWEMTPCGSSQKMIIIIVTAVETSNLTRYYLVKSTNNEAPLYVAFPQPPLFPLSLLVPNIF
jgi:hypothetical protein